MEFVCRSCYRVLSDPPAPLPKQCPSCQAEAAWKLIAAFDEPASSYVLTDLDQHFLRQLRVTADE